MRDYSKGFIVLFFFAHVDYAEYLLNFLYDHIAKAGDIQARVKWTPNTVVLWDNRITVHVRTYILSD